MHNIKFLLSRNWKANVLLSRNYCIICTQSEGNQIDMTWQVYITYKLLLLIWSKSHEQTFAVVEGQQQVGLISYFFFFRASCQYLARPRRRFSCGSWRHPLCTQNLLHWHLQILCCNPRTPSNDWALYDEKSIASKWLCTALPSPWPWHHQKATK